jgi:hypothetical protein
MRKILSKIAVFKLKILRKYDFDELKILDIFSEKSKGGLLGFLKKFQKFWAKHKRGALGNYVHFSDFAGT